MIRIATKLFIEVFKCNCGIHPSAHFMLIVWCFLIFSFSLEFNIYYLVFGFSVIFVLEVHSTQYTCVSTFFPNDFHTFNLKMMFSLVKAATAKKDPVRKQRKKWSEREKTLTINAIKVFRWWKNFSVLWRCQRTMLYYASINLNDSLRLNSSDKNVQFRWWTKINAYIALKQTFKEQWVENRNESWKRIIRR